MNFWEGLSAREYLQKVESSREATIQSVNKWFEDMCKNVDIALPLLAASLENLHKKVVEVDKIWLQAI